MKLNFYRKIRDVLVATNNRTDNSIITTCKMIQPIAADKGIDVAVKDRYNRRGLVRTMTPHLNRTTEDKRK